jgi:hypothetical protein
MPELENQQSHDPAVRSRPALYLAEFDTPDAIVKAAQAVRDAGYKRFDTHTPYPLHAMDEAMGLSDSKVGWIVLVAGLTGTLSAIAMMVWMNGIDYPLVIGGKPPVSIPTMVPIAFELTVLFSAFGAVFGMFHMNRLPRHHHPIFNSDRFASATDDKFFLSIEAQDPKFELSKTKALLESCQPVSIELVEDVA